MAGLPEHSVRLVDCCQHCVDRFVGAIDRRFRSFPLLNPVNGSLFEVRSAKEKVLSKKSMTPSLKILCPQGHAFLEFRRVYEGPADVAWCLLHALAPPPGPKPQFAFHTSLHYSSCIIFRRHHTFRLASENNCGAYVVAVGSRSVHDHVPVHGCLLLPEAVCVGLE
jgi:hypothetical protein